MNARIEELEVKALHAQVQLAEELEQVRRSFRAELTVPYRGGAIVRAADARTPFPRPATGARKRRRGAPMAASPIRSPMAASPLTRRRPPRRSRARSSASGAI